MSDTANTETVKPDEKAPQAVITVTEEQNAALATVADGVKKISGRMLKDYWSVGKLVDDVIKDCAEDAKKYGTNAIKRLNELTNVSQAELYNMNKVFRRNTEAQIDKLSEAGVFVTHVVHAADIVDDKQRMELLLAHASKDAEARLNNKEFKAVVEEVVATKDNQKALKEEQGADGAPKKGAGVRSGKPKDTATRSAMASVKSVGSLGEKLVDVLKDALIGLKDTDAMSDKGLENLVKAATHDIGIVLDVLVCGAAFAEVCEEFLANNETDGRRRRGQSSRKDSYVEVAGLLEKFAKGFDKTVAAGEKRLKEAEEEAAKEAEEAKEKAKEKAEKPKAEKKVEKKTEKPKASAGALSSLAALRERARKALQK
jgi:hypothetical protein